MRSRLHCCLFIALALIALPASLVHANVPRVAYGLHLNSHRTIGQQRTMLMLNDSLPIPAGDELQIAFEMDVRNEPDLWGPIMHISTDNGQQLHFSYALNEANKLSPAILCRDEIHLMNRQVKPGETFPVKLTLNQRANKIELIYGTLDTVIDAHIQGAKNYVIKFGRTNQSGDVAPVNIRDVRISRDGKPIYYWKLAQHDGDICHDEIQGAIARTSNPNWLIDKHVKWDLIFTDTIKGEADMVFDCKNQTLNLVQPEKIRQYSLYGQPVGTIAVHGGDKMTPNPGHCVFDPISEEIISYSLAEKELSRFSFDKAAWGAHPAPTQDLVHFNHARAFNPADSSYYFFGGYGHYAYHNDLYRVKPHSGVIESVEYTNAIPPRFGATMGIKDNKLYITGGRGNQLGKQALESYFYYDMWEIDLATMEARKLWEIPGDEMQKGWMLSNSMIWDDNDKAFYVVNMDDEGGKLLRISPEEPKVEPVSRPILNKNPYQDFDYSLFYCPEASKFVFIVDKIGVNKLHTISVYTLNTPLLDEASLLQTPAETKGQFPWWWIALGGVVVVAAAIWLILRGRKRKEVPDKGKVISQPTTPVESNASQTQEEEPEKKYYNTDKSFVGLLGCFGVRDKQGVDITSSFSPRIKQLLLLLVLYSEKSPKGISADRLTEYIWNDKDERSARNNRNVTVRRLRVLLEEVGNIDLKFDGGFIRIDFGDDCLCDYHELHKCYQQFEKAADGVIDPELRARIQELLLRGALLPNTQDELLDPFKDTASSMSLDMLSHLLHAETNRNVAINIAELMLLHDPLNEEALSAVCRMLAEQGKVGLAKSTYDRFARAFQDTMGEPFTVSFSDILSGKTE